MDQNEVIKKVVGILTEAYADVRPREGEDEADAEEPGLIGQFLTEAMPKIELSPDDSLEELADQVGREMGQAVTQLAAAFAAAYIELALVHDDGDPAVSSADVLRNLAIRAEAQAAGD
ncbi:hypothetical protein AB0P12_24650 [Streptomyces subrutilus]|nr:hypothetical protein [Streptomyces subrutilus]QEU79657.1 hypothetical protein CP968_16140 [Streptomyces subrutilus]WSJ31098.1 hypothetical protein OG479_18460 [Streptomyces subrutilus]